MTTRIDEMAKETKGSVLDALAEIYLKACLDREYVLCDILRLEIRRCIGGEKLLIHLEPSDGWLGQSPLF